VHASHEALTLYSPVAHPGSPWLTLLARCECLKRHGVGEREGELGADFTSLVLPRVGVALGTGKIVSSNERAAALPSTSHCEGEVSVNIAEHIFSTYSSHDANRSEQSC
jgi:hypothetical protein